MTFVHFLSLFRYSTENRSTLPNNSYYQYFSLVIEMECLFITQFGCENEWVQQTEGQADKYQSSFHGVNEFHTRSENVQNHLTKRVELSALLYTIPSSLPFAITSVAKSRKSQNEIFKSARRIWHIKPKHQSDSAGCAQISLIIFALK